MTEILVKKTHFSFGEIGRHMFLAPVKVFSRGEEKIELKGGLNISQIWLIHCYFTSICKHAFVTFLQ